MDNISENLESSPDFNKLFSDLSKEKENISEDLKVLHQSLLWRIDLYVSLDIAHFIAFMFNNEELNHCMLNMHYNLMMLTIYYEDMKRHPSTFKLGSYIERIDIIITNMEQLMDALRDTTDGLTIKGYDLFGLNKEISNYISIEKICDFLKANIINMNKSKKFIQEYFENRKSC